VDPTTFYSFRERRLPGRGPDRRWWPAILILLGTGALASAAYSVYISPQAPGPIAFASAIVAGVAILYNSLHSARQARIRFTLDATFQRFSNGVYASHARVLYRFKDQILAADSMEDLKKIPSTTTSGAQNEPSVAESLIYVLNYWEFIATAFVDGHLDREVFIDVIGEYIDSLIVRAAKPIGRVRGIDRGYWEHLTAVYFRITADDRRRQTVPLLGPAPPRLSPAEEYQWDAYQAAAAR
jgi:hypothetical protein